MEDAHAAGVDRGGRLEGADAAPCRLATDQADALVVDVVVEGAHRVGAAAHAGDHGVGQLALGGQDLRTRLLRDDRLEVADDGGEGVRAHRGADQVVGVVDAGGPLAEGLGDCVLERARAGVHAADLGAQQAHAVHVEGLALHVLDTHVDHALHAHQSGDGRGGHAVLAGAGLGDQAGLAHVFGEQGLAQGVVDLVRARVVEVLALEVNLGATQVAGHVGRVVEAGRPIGVGAIQLAQVSPELRVVLEPVVGLLQLDHGGHQRLGDVLAPVDAEAPFGKG